MAGLRYCLASPQCATSNRWNALSSYLSPLFSRKIQLDSQLRRGFTGGFLNRLTIGGASPNSRRRQLVKDTENFVQSRHGAVADADSLQLSIILEDKVDFRGEPLSLGGKEVDESDDAFVNELAAMTGASNDVPVGSHPVCVGIDPDLSGAIAVLRTHNDTTIAEVIDVPCVKVTVNNKMRRRHDYQLLSALVNDLHAPMGSIAYVEQAMPFPKDGKQGWYTSGYGYGVWIGILAASGFRVVPVQARAWKSAMGLLGKSFSKDDSRALASSFFPLLSSKLKRKKDHGRAEALLIAAFGQGLTLSNCSK